MKYSERLVEKIVRLIEEDEYTISEICDALKISRNSFYEWKKEKPEFRKAIEDAEFHRDNTLATLARKSLRDQLEGYIETTERIVYEDDGWGSFKMKSKVVTQKKKAPNVRILKLAMERQDKRMEKEELMDNSPERTPIIIKVPKGTEPDFAVQLHRDMIARINEERVPEDIPEKDDEMYDSYVV
jgi:hypothetical protein